MKKNRSLKFTLAIAAGLVVLCVVCLAFGAWFGNTPEGKAGATERAGKTAVAAAWTPTSPPTQTETPAPTLTPTVTLTPVPTLTPAPTFTPTPFYGISENHPTSDPELYDILVKNYQDMTDLQFETWWQTMIGKRIREEGRVAEVYEDGRVLINLYEGGNFVFSVDVPLEVAYTINKNQWIDLDATVYKITRVFGVVSTYTNEPVIWSLK